MPARVLASGPGPAGASGLGSGVRCTMGGSAADGHGSKGGGRAVGGKVAEYDLLPAHAVAGCVTDRGGTCRVGTAAAYHS